MIRRLGWWLRRLVLDTETSASRQHWIETGRYLRRGQAVTDETYPRPTWRIVPPPFDQDHPPPPR